VNAEYFSFNHCSNPKVVKHIIAILPWICVSILPDSLIIESINCSNLSCLVIASEQRDMRWVLDFETHQQLESLHWVVPSVHKVTHEDVTCVRNFPSFAKKLKQIVELTMDIATYCDWSSHWLDVAFFN
jgi:hypothetical protein